MLPYPTVQSDLGQRCPAVGGSTSAAKVHCEELAQSKARNASKKRKELKDTDLLAEAEVEHAGAKNLIAQIASMDEATERFDARVNVLGENIDHDVKEETNEIFPKERAARSLNLVAMRDDPLPRKEA